MEEEIIPELQEVLGQPMDLKDRERGIYYIGDTTISFQRNKWTINHTENEYPTEVAAKYIPISGMHLVEDKNLEIDSVGEEQDRFVEHEIIISILRDRTINGSAYISSGNHEGKHFYRGVIIDGPFMYGARVINPRQINFNKLDGTRPIPSTAYQVGKEVWRVDGEYLISFNGKFVNYSVDKDEVNAYEI